MNSIETMKLRNDYKQLVLDNGPYKYFLTITFKYNQSEYISNQQINFLLRLLNRKIFTRNNHTEYIDGFVFVENHKYFRDSIHYHLMIKDNQNFDLPDKKHLVEHFYDCLKKVKTNSNHPAFDEHNCRVQNVYDETGLVDYLTKSFEKSGDPSFIQPLYSNGIDRMYN